MSMDPKKKEIWATALESGEYPQGEGALHRDGTFCCLGVLSDVAVKNGLNISVTQHTDDYRREVTTYAGCDSYPPLEVQEWADLDNYNPRIEHPKWGRATLAELNDHYAVPFPELAKLIREQL